MGMTDFIGGMDDEYLASLLHTYYDFPGVEFSKNYTRAKDFESKYKSYLKDMGTDIEDNKKTFEAIKQQLIEEAALRFIRSHNSTKE